MFLTELERQDGIVTEFDENLWYSLLNYVTVFNVLFLRYGEIRHLYFQEQER